MIFKLFLRANVHVTPKATFTSELSGENSVGSVNISKITLIGHPKLVQQKSTWLPFPAMIENDQVWKSSWNRSLHMFKAKFKVLLMVYQLVGSIYKLNVIIFRVSANWCNIKAQHMTTKEYSCFLLFLSLHHLIVL